MTTGQVHAINTRTLLAEKHEWCTAHRHALVPRHTNTHLLQVTRDILNNMF
jgi:hypothetical protein